MATILLFGGNFEPQGWAYCNGQIMSIAQNSALFALVGTTYGGDGRVTFALPDLRGRVAVGTGQGPGRSNYVLGQLGGVESQTLTQGQLPAHTHSVGVPTTDGTGTSDEPNGNILALQNATVYAAAGAANGTYGGVTASAAGGNQPVSLVPPYLALNYIIALEGIFPSRN
jgi:microcystin-dependent protein